MWFFNSPQIVYGEDSITWLYQLRGERAFIVTDANMVKLGFLQKLEEVLNTAGVECTAFTEVEPEPCLETVIKCSSDMEHFSPDWIIGLGGGSCLDTAKAAWFHYERPDIELEAINPMEFFGLRSKAHLITIPTTAGSGAEVTAAAVIKDNCSRRKMELATHEVIADITIVDPLFTQHLPKELTAETGIDALVHAVEGYSCTWNNDFSDGLCLQATKLIFTYLPRACARGENDPEAREKMANAATISGLGMGNSHIALAHGMGHSAGTIFHLPHGKATGLFLPYTIEFNGIANLGRYLGLAQFLGLPAYDESQASILFADCIRELIRKIGLPTSLREAGVSVEDFYSQIDALCETTMTDASLATSRRIPTWEELRRLFQYVYDGRLINF